MAGVRIAVWSGPRNLSTAMMRSFEARGDCAVIDEPFYGHYLKATGIDHPMRDEILAAHESDLAAIVETLTGPIPGGAPLFYQKQMPHHMVADPPMGWAATARHALLIRAPERVVASFDAKRPAPTLEDIGAPQMDRIDAELTALLGAPPPVIEAEDVRAAPGPMLAALCAALDIPYRPKMLSWPAGKRATDGIWGRHWYPAVEASTGFAPPAGPLPDLPPHLAEIAAAARPSYERLRERKLTPLNLA